MALAWSIVSLPLFLLRFIGLDDPRLIGTNDTKMESEDPVDFHAGDAHEYMLDRSYAAASRLNFQFYLWKESLKFNLHPSIPITRNQRIADVGTGTAIWASEVARQLPNAQVDGLDISLDQAPAQEWLPPNVHLRKWNMLEDVPDDMIKKYDIVHLRLLILVVENSNPRPIIQNVAKMLKPGGYMQWDDLNYPDICIKKIKDMHTPALDELRETTYSRGRGDWVMELPNTCTELGFTEAAMYHFEDRADLIKANGDQHLLTMEEFGNRLRSVGNMEGARKIEDLIRGSYKESCKGAAFSMPRAVCVARKPKV